MDAGSEPDGQSGILATQAREATVKQVLGMLQTLGAPAPLEALKAAGLAGVALIEDKNKEKVEMSQGDRLAQSTARLKQLADQQRKVRKQTDELEEVIKSQQAELASLHSALATLEKDYADTAAACTLAGAKRGVDETETAPQESIQVLEGLSKILDDGAYLNAAYTSYLAPCDANQAQPEPAAL